VQRVAVVAQPAGQLRHQSRMWRCVDDVLVGAHPADHEPDRRGHGQQVEVGRAAEADLVVATAQFVERAVGDDLALVEDDHPVGEAFGFVELVGGEHHGAPLGGERADDAADGVAAEDVDARGRLVEERHLGPCGQRQGE